jgi:ERCC4-type nuclease
MTQQAGQECDGEPFTFICDTRERQPYGFSARTTLKALDAGDYSVVGHEAEIAVERKSLDDFVNTVIRARARFHDELKKLARYRFACIVVEASFQDILSEGYTSGATGFSVAQAAMSIIVDWHVPIFFCGDRQGAREFTTMFLQRAVQAIRGKNNQ